MTDPQTAADAAERNAAYTDSDSPWSDWLVRQLLDREWTSSALVEASGDALNVKQVSRWLHSQDVPDPWNAITTARAFQASAAEALCAAGYGAIVDAVLPDRARMAAELEQVRRDVTLPILRQAWRNGWSDRARAVRDAVRTSDNERDAYERAFARYMSEDPAEADKDPYRPLDGPDDPAAMPTHPAGGSDAEGAGKGPESP